MKKAWEHYNEKRQIQVTKHKLTSLPALFQPHSVVTVQQNLDKLFYKECPFFPTNPPPPLKRYGCGTYWLVSIPLNIFSVRVPGGGCSQGCHGYLLSVLNVTQLLPPQGTNAQGKVTKCGNSEMTRWQGDEMENSTITACSLIVLKWNKEIKITKWWNGYMM